MLFSCREAPSSPRTWNLEFTFSLESENEMVVLKFLLPVPNKPFELPAGFKIGMCFTTQTGVLSRSALSLLCSSGTHKERMHQPRERCGVGTELCNVLGGSKSFWLDWAPIRAFLLCFPPVCSLLLIILYSLPSSIMWWVKSTLLWDLRTALLTARTVREQCTFASCPSCVTKRKLQMVGSAAKVFQLLILFCFRVGTICNVVSYNITNEKGTQNSHLKGCQKQECQSSTEEVIQVTHLAWWLTSSGPALSLGAVRCGWRAPVLVLA